MPAFGKALCKGLDILEALEVADTALSYTELQRRIEVSSASFARFLRILAEREYVRTNEQGHYLLGTRMLSLGKNSAKHNDLISLAKPLLKELADKSHEAAELVELSATHFTFLDRMESPQAIVLKARQGSRFAYSGKTALCKLAVAFGWVKHNDLPFAVEFEELEIIRKKNFVRQLQNNDEVCRSATAILAAKSLCRGCLCIAAPAFRVNVKQEQLFRQMLGKATMTLAKQLGYKSLDFPERSR